jgi:hypothetical protein
MNIKDYRIVHIKDTNYGSKKVIIHVKKAKIHLSVLQEKRNDMVVEKLRQNIIMKKIFEIKLIFRKGNH